MGQVFFRFAVVSLTMSPIHNHTRHPGTFSLQTAKASGPLGLAPTPTCPTALCMVTHTHGGVQAWVSWGPWCSRPRLHPVGTSVQLPLVLGFLLAEPPSLWGALLSPAVAGRGPS